MNVRERILDRRKMLRQCGMGMGAVALTSLLGGTGQLAAAPVGDAHLSPQFSLFIQCGLNPSRGLQSAKMF